MILLVVCLSHFRYLCSQWFNTDKKQQSDTGKIKKNKLIARICLHWICHG